MEYNQWKWNFKNKKCFEFQKMEKREASRKSKLAEKCLNFLESKAEKSESQKFDSAEKWPSFGTAQKWIVLELPKAKKKIR